MKHLIGYIWYKYIGFLFRLLPIKKNRIVMSNLLGKGYGDNPKYIANELLSRKDVDLEIVWLVKDKYYDDIPREIKQVKRGTIKELYYLSTAKIWVDNSRKHIGVTKRKSQYYIQTWHGDLFIKMLEKDVEESLPKMYIDSAIAVSTDDFNKLKGKTAYHNYETRKMMLEAVRYVDLVIPEENWEQKIEDVKKYDVDTVVMGSDWAGSERFDYLKDYCDVVYLPRTDGVSTTKIKNDLELQEPVSGVNQIPEPRIYRTARNDN